jgi:cytochrome c55X
VKALAFAVLLSSLVPAAVRAQHAPDAQRQRELVRMVRQDCGSCHGMRLTGGLGPPLDAARLAQWPLESLVATIHQGRPGTPMPAWSARLSRADSPWMAQQLPRGFPGGVK